MHKKSEQCSVDGLSGVCTLKLKRGLDSGLKRVYSVSEKSPLPPGFHVTLHTLNILQGRDLRGRESGRTVLQVGPGDNSRVNEIRKECEVYCTRVDPLSPGLHVTLHTFNVVCFVPSKVDNVQKASFARTHTRQLGLEILLKICKIGNEITVQFFYQANFIG